LLIGLAGQFEIFHDDFAALGWQGFQLALVEFNGIVISVAGGVAGGFEWAVFFHFHLSDFLRAGRFGGVGRFGRRDRDGGAVDVGGYGRAFAIGVAVTGAASS
jgi:hypothetical protein